MSDKEKDPYKTMNRRRKSLFLNDEVKRILKDLSTQYGVPESQLVSFLILAGAANVDKVQDVIPRYLVPSNSPAWRHTLDLDRFRADLDGSG